MNHELQTNLKVTFLLKSGKKTLETSHGMEWSSSKQSNKQNIMTKRQTIKPQTLII